MTGDNETNSEYRVALELAEHIANSEDQDRTREYWLLLYQQCRRVVKDGARAETALTD